MTQKADTVFEWEVPSVKYYAREMPYSRMLSRAARLAYSAAIVTAANGLTRNAGAASSVGRVAGSSFGRFITRPNATVMRLFRQETANKVSSANGRALTRLYRVVSGYQQPAPLCCVYLL